MNTEHCVAGAPPTTSHRPPGDGHPSLRHCRACHLPSITNPCTACRTATHNTLKRLWPSKAAPRWGAPPDTSDTNEADLAAFLDNAAHDTYGGPRHTFRPPPTNPTHGCAGPGICRTRGCPDGEA